MASRKKREYRDYEELGLMLQIARSALMKAQLKANRMFPVHSRNYKMVSHLLSKVEDVKCELDEAYCDDISEDSVPPGHPRLPLYPDNVYDTYDGVEKMITNMLAGVKNV